MSRSAEIAIPTDHPILLYDGVCNLCNHSVQFVIKRDSKQQFRFAALQSDVGRKLLETHQFSADHLDSIVLIEDGKAYSHSTAALRVSRQLNSLWPLLYFFILIPAPLRNWVYNWIANNRYRWFGKQDTCMLPSPETRTRFLDV
ncbi:MAG: thiol-disulfide oxidoreductase DCC family protein [Bacteroidota bacterium]